MIGFILFVIGAVFGSFLNVVIYRLPRKMSIVNPPSHCPVCGERIKPYDNIPILSYIILRGRCRNCGAMISPRYTIVESIVAFSFLFGYLRFGLGMEYIGFVLLTLLLVPIAFIDLDVMLIPDSIAIPGIVIGLLVGIFRGFVVQSFLGGVAGASTILFFYYVGKLIYKREAMGLGDVRIGALIGAFTGWAGWLISLVIAAFLGSIYGILLVRIKGGDLKNEIPFGPFLAMGGYAVYIWGSSILKLFQI